jgi:hypothetical protein
MTSYGLSGDGAGHFSFLFWEAQRLPAFYQDQRFRGSL